MGKIILLCLLAFFGGWADAQPIGPQKFKPVPEGNDTLFALSLLRLTRWNVTICNGSGQTRLPVTNSPDTARLSAGDTVHLTTTLRIEPGMVNEDLALRYTVTGSVMMQINGRYILATGTFARGANGLTGLEYSQEFTDFDFDDTVCDITIVYLPHPNIRYIELGLDLFRNNSALHTYQALRSNNVVNKASISAYYIAFAIIFFGLFFFYRSNRENLYISMFCFFIAAAFFLGISEREFPATMGTAFGILGAESCCIFLYKILRNRERSRIPFTVLSVIAALCLLPQVHYLHGAIFKMDEGNLTIELLSDILLLYGLYILGCLVVWGIRNNNKDTRKIFASSLAGGAIYIFVPLLKIIFPALANVQSGNYLNYIGNLGLCIIPVGAALVVGKRNGENLRLLLQQEQEKQRLLLDQKESLEREVTLRTAEIRAQKEQIEQQHEDLISEKKKTDDLLLNILPANVAAELKATGRSAACLFNNVTVLFTDFVNFTSASENMSPQALIDELDACFRGFDEIVTELGLEKIKTIGDAYMAVAGMPQQDADHAGSAIRAAILIRDFMSARRNTVLNAFEVRIGIHSGPVVAGIVGTKKFAYDIWGDTVNTAARMEQHSEAGRINVSQATYELAKDRFSFQYRGELEAKNKGRLNMYFVA